MFRKNIKDVRKRYIWHFNIFFCGCILERKEFYGILKTKKNLTFFNGCALEGKEFYGILKQKKWGDNTYFYEKMRLKHINCWETWFDKNSLNLRHLNILIMKKNFVDKFAIKKEVIDLKFSWWWVLFIYELGSFTSLPTSKLGRIRWYAPQTPYFRKWGDFGFYAIASC